MTGVGEFMKRYFYTLSQLATAPKRFFSASEEPQRRMPPVSFLAFSSIISALSAMLLGRESGNLVQAAIWVVNGFGMALLASIFAYAVMMVVAGSRVSFSRLFGVFAHSSGVTLLISWNPILLLLTEPWKWWLVWTGIRMGCGLSRWQAAITLVLGFALIVMLFQILLPLTAPDLSGGP
jgi:hypothetical protein